LSKCGSNKFTPTEEKKICIDYQEMRLQEQFKHISAGRLPQSVVVVMEGPMGATWRPGDDLVVSGVLEYRFKKPANDQRMQMQLIIVANTVRVLSSSLGREQGDRESLYDGTQESIHLSLERIAPREKLSQEIELRNAAIAKFCPNIYGRDNIKLGIMLGILGGVSIHN
jgi:DNA helicase MCM9